MEDSASLHNCINDGGKPRSSEDQGSRIACRIRGSAHSDAAVRLFQGWRVIHTVARHRDDMAARLKRFDNFVFVLRKDPGEAVCGFHGAVHIDWGVIRIALSVEDLLGGDKMAPEPKLGGDLVPDGHIIACHHLDGEPKLLRLADGFFSVGPRRVHQRQYSEEVPGLSSIPGLCDAQRAVSPSCKAAHGGAVFLEDGPFKTAECRDSLRRTLGIAFSLAFRRRHRGTRHLMDGIEGREGRLLVALEER